MLRWRSKRERQVEHRLPDLARANAEPEAENQPLRSANSECSQHAPHSQVSATTTGDSLHATMGSELSTSAETSAPRLKQPAPNGRPLLLRVDPTTLAFVGSPDTEGEFLVQLFRSSAKAYESILLVEALAWSVLLLADPRSSAVCLPACSFAVLVLWARRRVAHMHANLTTSRGTPIFSAPEQLAREAYDVSADVWALGCVICCVYTDASLPYPEEVMAQKGMLAKVMAGELSPTLPDKSPMRIVVRACCTHADRRADIVDAQQLIASCSREEARVPLAATAVQRDLADGIAWS